MAGSCKGCPPAMYGHPSQQCDPEGLTGFVSQSTECGRRGDVEAVASNSQPTTLPSWAACRWVEQVRNRLDGHARALQDREYVEKTNLEGKEQETHHLLIPTPTTWPPKEEIKKHTVGAEKNKLRVTPTGRSVIQFLAKEFDDLFSYDYTAKMETELDRIGAGEREWKSLLQESWDSYKTRYETFTGKEGKQANKAALCRILSPTIQVAQTRKGPLVVRPPPDGSPKTVKPEYAALPPLTTFDTITL